MLGDDIIFPMFTSRWPEDWASIPRNSEKSHMRARYSGKNHFLSLRITLELNDG